MVTEWSDIKLDVVPYRDTGTYIIQGTDEIQVMLDDHILRAQTMRGSPYIKPFETEMEAWESKLINMQDILDIWLQVQGTWMYLEPIFSSEDIMRQMPEESRNFKTVDQIWKTIMLFVNKDPHILQATEMEDMLKNFNKCNLMLELIQKGLNDYLEKKRLFFPRFFFLSNDELLEILSETKDPLRVQPHLKKIFEGINLLEYSDSLEIIGMISLEGEKVALSGLIRPNDAKGLVEKWLQQVEDLMIKSLQDICMMALGAYYKSERVVWVTKWPGMVVICVSSITWTAEVEKAIQGRKLDAMLDKSVKQIDIMVIKVRGKLLMSERITICALIVIDVHAKEVVASLVESKVTQVEDFAWMSQLRYYNVNNLVNVCMITTTVQYGYEYLGNSDRLVITPLTDRCYRTLMSALKLHLGGAPEGPAGTGKTETSKDLAKAVAKQCIVFNCSDTLDYKAMGKFFKGVASAGEKVLFLIEKSRLEPTDIEMNSKIFRWLSKIGDMLEDSIRAINTKRESVETSLELRVAEFDKLLKEHCKMLTAIEKSVTGNTTEEFKKAHKEVLTLLDLLQKDRTTARQINEEQELLKMVRTNYETVDEMLERLEPFDQLWSIILEFRESSDLWMEGPFKGLNADEIKDKTDFMFRELNQLARKMTRAPGCKMVNDLTRSKLESFRKEVPILQCISNPGMEERHWKILSDELGQDITPNDQTSLKNMLDL
ncbi:dynein heavy chain 3, axonemal-like, partial [Diaphorina citri]|uniref:Dynein heavy chain 3, axonemal-like n=1 Tax=Diaphorina citri TaxID=121845 RepID=A0A3Q0JGM1_DIACI